MLLGLNILEACLRVSTESCRMSPRLLQYQIPSPVVQNAKLAAEYIFRSRLPDIHIPNQMPLASYVLEHASKFGEKPCIIDGKTGKIYTYGEVEVIAQRVAAGLDKMGIGKGDVLMLLLPNCPEFILLFLGAATRGAVVTPGNPFCTSNEIEKQVRSSGTRLIVTQSATVEKITGFLQESDDDIQILTIDGPLDGPHGHVSSLLEADERQCPAVDIYPDDVVALPYSSGTTSLPKGVELTHKNIVTAISQQVDGDNPNVYLHSDDKMLCVLPLFHVYCMSCVLFNSLRVGAGLVLMQKYEIGAMLELIQRYRVTAACWVPPIVLAIANNPIVENYDLSSMRLVMCGAAPLGKDLEDAFRLRMPKPIIAQGYGMTEAGPLISMSLAFARNPVSVKPGSCGSVVRNTEAKIVDTETGESLPCNKHGEICIRGPQVMKGYLNNHEATASTIDKGGWLHTGDIGYIDEDDEMFIVDRVKELIKFKGFQVPPAEIEAILISHPSISDAAVVGKNDEVAGEVPVAFVVRTQGSHISKEELKKFVARQVVFYKKLSQVIFITSIPKSAAGKILRKELRSILNS